MCVDQDIIENGPSKPDRVQKQKYLLYCRRKIIIFHSSGQLQFSQGATALKGGNVSKLKNPQKLKTNVSSSWPQSLPEARLSYSLVILGLQLILPSLVQSFNLNHLCDKV